MPRQYATIEGFCNKLHKTLLKQLKYANVWGASVKHRPQKVRPRCALARVGGAVDGGGGGGY
jgi:ribosome-interacting GTPase 1